MHNQIHWLFEIAHLGGNNFVTLLTVLKCLNDQINITAITKQQPTPFNLNYQTYFNKVQVHPLSIHVYIHIWSVFVNLSLYFIEYAQLWPFRVMTQERCKIYLSIYILMNAFLYYKPKCIYIFFAVTYKSIKQ